MGETGKINLLSQQYLFAIPGIFSGIAAAFDITGNINMYNASASPELADILAFKSDMRAISQDLFVTAATYAPTHVR